MSGPSGPAPCSKATLDKLSTFTLHREHSTLGKACAICLENFAEGSQACKLPCTHDFHPDCIRHWLAHHNSCPSCREPLPVEHYSSTEQAPPSPGMPESRTASTAAITAALVAA